MALELWFNELTVFSLIPEVVPGNAIGGGGGGGAGGAGGGGGGGGGPHWGVATTILVSRSCFSSSSTKTQVKCIFIIVTRWQFKYFVITVKNKFTQRSV